MPKLCSLVLKAKEKTVFINKTTRNMMKEHVD